MPTDRKESTADIVVNTGNGEVVIERLTVTKEIDVETNYGSSATLPDSYSINSINYQGTMTILGNRKDVIEAFFDSNGIPIPAGPITITHFDGSEKVPARGDGGTTSLYDIIVTNRGYEANSEEVTETTMEFVAMRMDSDQNPL